ncbi:hydroxyacid dehydrogenase [Rhodopseudomonas boonkerdii]|jgi:phosphonate dehydrogenase|uniref:phosphonate dehydrogenase n=1 Tax=Hyphomicrobiales TaxID=356 RepID=UPI000BCA6511|nr:MULTISPECIES: phosphonate dehydrogenase [Hyphomicrobiales]KAB2760767.1 hydroxyacid dehydrogenase [Brucella anthropi]OYU86265.1 MAG: hydroxyacid dehydrogenase [Bradyrhizobiaceae bacterium PARB1]UGV24955.1 hydroxyacid dehydrogenase [Rhodopseudomonas boonkerdii]
MTRKTLVTNWVHPEVLDLLRTRGDVDANLTREPWPQAEIIRRAADADAIMTFMTDTIDNAFLDACPNLKVVACALKGADNFDIEACKARGVEVAVVQDLLTAPTAELAIGLMITLARKILSGDRVIREKPFAGWRPILYGLGLDGSNVGIVGMGAVGQAVAHRLWPFRCRMSYTDQTPLSPTNEDRLGLIRRNLSDILANSDYLVLTLPLTASSQHLINAASLSALKPGALLINPARGSLVDEAAVADALEQGTLGGYAADVFETEDWARPDRPSGIEPRLLSHQNTVFTPHIGSAVDNVRRDIALDAARDILRHLDGLPMRGRLF